MNSSHSYRSSRRRQTNNSLQYDNIDRQILVLHKAMANKLVTHRELRQQVIDTLESRYTNGQLRHGGYLIWTCLMEYIDDEPDVFIQGVLADTPQMRKLRRRTPFVNLLTEEERMAALNETALCP
ncbi:hypothetical protein [Paraglaciecola sp. L1A13]|uniref:hypothetical protein n=1 Tax=Paraglaciecola sp. L1A13 TaxID=2686359 RepID=UPI00131C60E4|nr:hypothetical protein [Paraglaciecola sp. L1A13]|tara:strand:+ start:836 stop:1210 length:375 start_codon:yes stop_codon:yes gene_type:complete